MAQIYELMKERDDRVGSGLRQIGFDGSDELISRHRDKVEQLADALAARLSLDESGIIAILGDGL